MYSTDSDHGIRITSLSELSYNIESFLRVCQEIGLKLHAEKLKLFATEVQICGRVFSEQGV